MESAPAIGARLPRRPRLARGIGVYLREGDEVQVGLDPRHAVVLSDVPCTVAGIVRALDGRDTLPALLRSAGAYAGELRTVLHTLVARGLVTECTPAGAATPESTVVVHGDGPLAAAVAVLLAAVGVHRVVPECAGIVSPREAGRTLLPYDVGLRRRSAVEAAMRAVDPAVTTGAPTSSRTPDLVVLTDALVPPPELVHRLMADRRPHLLARFRDGIGVVGPLVLPGRSSCLHCADLHRAGRDAS